MAKKRRRKSRKGKVLKRRGQRKTSEFSLNHDRLLSSPIRDITVEDKRTFHPDGHLRSRKTVYGYEAEKQVLQETSNISNKFRFINPKKTIVCKKREQRRNILFKIGKIGKGKSGPKKRRITKDSKIRCK